MMVDRAIRIAQKLIDTKGYTKTRARIETIVEMSKRGATCLEMDQFKEKSEKALRYQ